MPIQSVVSGQSKLSAEIVAALNAADSPSAVNPFVTGSGVPSLSSDIVDALNGANAPDAGNVFATMADTGGGGTSLSDYKNVVVVDQDGNGDYITQAAAAAAITDDDASHIYNVFVFGEAVSLSLWAARPYCITHGQGRDGMYRLANGAIVRDQVAQAASGAFSFAAGYLSTAAGKYSTCFGKSNTASGDYSFAVGKGNTASSDYSMASGRNNTSSAFYSSVRGKNSQATAGYTTAVGFSTIASGEFSFANGNTCTASGIGSFSHGDSAVASGQLSVAVGGYLSALAKYSFALGLESKAISYGQVAHAAGKFSVAGDNQASKFIARRAIASHADNTKYELFCDGVSEKMIVPVNTAWAIRALVVGSTSGQLQTWSYQLTGQVINSSGAMSVIFTRTAIGESDAAYDVELAVDDTLDALVVQVFRSGGTDYNIRWAAQVDIIEAGY